MHASDEVARRRPISGSTRVVGVIGWPVDHSLSPAIHNAAFAALDLDWAYVPLPVPPGSLRAAADGLVGLGMRGANVTMPHKTESAGLADELSEEARRLDAVNTFAVVGDGVLEGHNTDASGFDRFLRRDAGFDPAGRRALVYGAGGAARAVALALATGGVATIEVAVRDRDRAAPLLAAVDGTDADVRIVDLEAAPDARPDLLVNATPVGTDGASALPTPPLGPGVQVVDLLYRPAVTPLLAAARDAGADAHGGLGMLLHQAALSFELWTGSPAPLDVMSAAALAAVGERS
jgi:shikimate dehydrogenase